MRGGSRLHPRLLTVVGVALWRWLRRLAPDVGDAGGSFEEFTRRQTLVYLRVAFVVFILSALLWWPLDVVLMGPVGQATFAMSRPVTASIIAVGLGLTFFHWERPPFTFVSITAVGVAFGATMGAFMARIGGVESVYFHFSFLLPFAGVVIVRPFVPRVLVTLACTLAYPAGFLWSQPEGWASASLPLFISYLVFCVLLACAVGHLVYVHMRDSFFQRALLEERIAERTAVLRQLATHLAESQEHERRRVSRELHDETAQLLTAIRLELALLKASLGGAFQESLDRLEGAVDQSFVAHRAIIRSLHPRVLEQQGVVAAIEQHVDRVRDHVPVELALDDLPRLDARVELALYRVVQELLTNVARHADATGATVELRGGEEVVTLTVRDDGRGFDPGVGADGFGLLGMRERVRALGGALTIESAPGQGTTARVTLPAQEVKP